MSVRVYNAPPPSSEAATAPARGNSTDSAGRFDFVGYCHDRALPATWYPDPSDPAQLRYWDGTAWTGHTRPRPLLGIVGTVLYIVNYLSMLGHPRKQAWMDRAARTFVVRA